MDKEIIIMSQSQRNRGEDEPEEEPESPTFEGQMVFKGDFDSDEDE